MRRCGEGASAGPRGGGHPLQRMHSETWLLIRPVGRGCGPGGSTDSRRSMGCPTSEPQSPRVPQKKKTIMRTCQNVLWSSTEPTHSITATFCDVGIDPVQSRAREVDQWKSEYRTLAGSVGNQSNRENCHSTFKIAEQRRSCDRRFGGDSGLAQWWSCAPRTPQCRGWTAR